MNNSNLAYQLEIREELIGGEIVAMSPRPGWNHISISGNIFNLFSNYLYRKECTPIPDGCDLFLTEKDHYVPDMMVVCDRSKIKKDGVHGAPDLVVEVLSPGTAKNDRTRKKSVYARCGVREYWIVDPANRLVEQHLLREGELVLDAVYPLYPDWELRRMSEEERGEVVDRFRCSLFDDFDIPLEDIFRGMLPDGDE